MQIIIITHERCKAVKQAGKAELSVYRLHMIKKPADTDDYLRGSMTWARLLEGKGNRKEKRYHER